MIGGHNAAGGGIYCAIAGGGPRGTFLAGAAAGLSDLVSIHGFSGASVGAIIAALKAFAIPDRRIKSLFAELLDGRFTAVDPSSIARGGILKWTAISEACDQVLGCNARMGDSILPLVIGVTCLDTRSPMQVSKRWHPHAKISEVLTASCAFSAGATPAVQIPSLSLTKYSPDIRLFVDGGYTDNCVDSAWRDKVAPTVLLRLAPSEPARVRVEDIGAIAGAVLDSAFWAQSQPKTADLVVDVKSSGGWDFRKTEAQVLAEYEIGRQTVSGLAAQLREIAK